MLAAFVPHAMTEPTAAEVAAARSIEPASPCLQCGACCSAFRVSFYWAEAAELPQRYVEQVNPWYACMVGTNNAAPRCAALEGEIGGAVGLPRLRVAAAGLP